MWSNQQSVESARREARACLCFVWCVVIYGMVVEFVPTSRYLTLLITTTYLHTTQVSLSHTVDTTRAYPVPHWIQQTTYNLPTISLSLIAYRESPIICSAWLMNRGIALYCMRLHGRLQIKSKNMKHSQVQ